MLVCFFTTVVLIWWAQTSSMWELVRNAKFLAIPQMYGVRNSGAGPQRRVSRAPEVIPMHQV